MQADLVEQVADLAGRPEAGQELVAAVVGEGGRVAEVLRLAVDFAAQRDRRRAAFAVAAEHDQLGAGKEVGQRRGIDLLDVDAADVDWTSASTGALIPA